MEKMDNIRTIKKTVSRDEKEDFEKLLKKYSDKLGLEFDIMYDQFQLKTQLTKKYIDYKLIISGEDEKIDQLVSILL